MTIKRITTINVVCNGCGKLLAYEGARDFPTLARAREAIKAREWTTTVSGKQMIHRCPPCAGESSALADRMIEAAVSR